MLDLDATERHVVASCDPAELYEIAMELVVEVRWLRQCASPNMAMPPIIKTFVECGECHMVWPYASDEEREGAISALWSHACQQQ